KRDDPLEGRSPQERVIGKEPVVRVPGQEPARSFGEIEQQHQGQRNAPRRQAARISRQVNPAQMGCEKHRTASYNRGDPVVVLPPPTDYYARRVPQGDVNGSSMPPELVR